MSALAAEKVYEAFPKHGGRGSALPKGYAGKPAPRSPQSHGTRLALAIVLLWAAGLCMYVAVVIGRRMQNGQGSGPVGQLEQTLGQQLAPPQQQ